MSDWCQFMTEPHEAAKGSEYSELPVSNGSPGTAGFRSDSPEVRGTVALHLGGSRTVLLSRRTGFRITLSGLGFTCMITKE